MNLRIPKVWELIDHFRGHCRIKGWKASEHEDWVRTGDDEYHNFLWIQTVHPSTFKKIVKNHKCAIRKGVSYQVVNISYIAWIFPQSPPENLLESVRENPELSARTAIYDLSWAYSGKPICLKLNKTGSVVFKEFESFLEKLGVDVRPAQKLPTLKT